MHGAKLEAGGEDERVLRACWERYEGNLGEKDERGRNKVA